MIKKMFSLNAKHYSFKNYRCWKMTNIKKHHLHVIYAWIYGHSIRGYPLEIELIRVIKLALDKWRFVYTHLCVKTQLHAYSPDFAANSPVYLSHQRLCLSFTKIKCVSVRNSSIFCPSTNLTATRQHVCNVKQNIRLPPTTKHSPCCLWLTLTH